MGPIGAGDETVEGHDHFENHSSIAHGGRDLPSRVNSSPIGRNVPEYDPVTTIKSVHLLPAPPLREKELRAWNPCLVTVRRARSEDATAMARVMAAVAEEGSIATEPPVDIEARAQQFRETIEGEGPGALWVLEDGGQVVGNAGVQEAGPGVLSLGMAIIPEARGRGGGRALLEVIAEHARVSGAHKLELDVWPDNARAVRLYASAGFEVEGLRRAHYRRRDGSLRSALLMARLLGAGKR